MEVQLILVALGFVLFLVRDALEGTDEPKGRVRANQAHTSESESPLNLELARILWHLRGRGSL